MRKLNVVCISPHADDASIFCGGTLAKYARDGHAVSIVRVTNDDKDSFGMSREETIEVNAREAAEAFAILGATQTFHLDYPNDDMDPIPETDIREKFIRVFREVKADIVISFDPWGIYEENPDHTKCAVAADDACWQSGGDRYNPEHFEQRLAPHTVAERLYFARRLPEINHIVDITDTIDAKIAAVCAHRNMMSNMVRTLREKLRANRLRIPWLDEMATGGEGQEANLLRQGFAGPGSCPTVLIERFLREAARAAGARIGVPYGEAFRRNRFGELDGFIAEHAVAMED
jgi:LmbE family N-acetylglucosaminyl deacetylase